MKTHAKESVCYWQMSSDSYSDHSNSGGEESDDDPSFDGSDSSDRSDSDDDRPLVAFAAQAAHAGVTGPPLAVQPGVTGPPLAAQPGATGPPLAVQTLQHQLDWNWSRDPRTRETNIDDEFRPRPTIRR